jgi:hypothetical protein
LVFMKWKEVSNRFDLVKQIIVFCIRLKLDHYEDSY